MNRIFFYILFLFAGIVSANDSDLSSLLNQNRVRGILNGGLNGIEKGKLDISKANDLLKKQPVKFLENKGQMTDTEGNPVPFVLFKAEAVGVDLFITEKGLTYVFSEREHTGYDKRSRTDSIMGHEKNDAIIKMEWVNVLLKDAVIKKENVIKEGVSINFRQYFLAHCPKGITDVREYDKLIIKEVYPGIDWVFYNSSEKGFKYDFIVHPSADPSKIKMIYESSRDLELKKDGSFRIETSFGSLTENAPFSYIKETGAEIKSSFKRNVLEKNRTEISFELGSMPSQVIKNTLIIDPQLKWSTIFGGNYWDQITNVGVNSNNDLYITGLSESTNFPFQTPATAYSYTVNTFGARNAIICKFSSSGVLMWSTLYGGSWDECGRSIAFDASSNVYVVGESNSTDFPTQTLAGAYNQLPNSTQSQDGFILKFNSIGALLWATSFCGPSSDYLTNIKIDSNGIICIVGSTDSSYNFPILSMAGAYFQLFNAGFLDIFIAKFNSTGALLWSTYYGGVADDNGWELVIDNGNNLFIGGHSLSANFPTQNLAGAYNQNTNGGGQDGILLKFGTSSQCLWSTFFGGSNSEAISTLAVDNAGSLYCTGITGSSNLPIVVLPGAYNQTVIAGGSEAFVAKFNSSLSCIWSTFFGGSSNEQESINGSSNILIDQCQKVYISFCSDSPDLPLKKYPNSYYDSTLLFSNDLVLTRFTSAGVLEWSTFFGGDGLERYASLASDNTGKMYMAGLWVVNTPSTYPLVNPGGGAYFDQTTLVNNGYISAFILDTLMVSKSQANPSYCACDGVATISVTSGEGPYTYIWSNNFTQSNVNTPTCSATNLCPGVYQVTVIANCNESLISTFTISGTMPTLTANVSILNATSCITPTGSITFTGITNGIPNYTVTELTNTLVANATSIPFSVNNVSVGIHTYIVQGSNGCVSLTFNLGQTGIPNLSAASSASVTCSQTNVILQGNSTTPNVTYTWIPQNVNSNSVTVTSPGVYTLGVSDPLSGCSSYTTVSVLQNTVVPNLVVSSSGTIMCFPSFATLQGNSTTSNVTYTWIPQNVNTASASVSTGGVYTLSVTDPLNGCINSKTVSPSQNTVLPNLNVTVPSTLSCSQTSVQLQGLSTTSNTTYTWQPQNVNTPSAFATSPGNYTFSVTDPINGCTSSSVVQVFQASTPTLSIVSLTNVSCDLGNDGAVASQIAGGTAPFQYYWNTLPAQTTPNASSLQIGSYTLTVSDAYNCIVTLTVQLNMASAIQPSVSVSSNTLSSSPSMQYQWYFNNSPISGATQQNHVFTQNGTYKVCVTDSNGCTNCSDTLQILDVGLRKSGILTNCSIFPNPNNGNFTVKLYGYSGKIEILLLNNLGQVVLDWVLNNGTNEIEERTDLARGLYHCLIKVEGEVVKKTKVEIIPD